MNIGSLNIAEESNTAAGPPGGLNIAVGPPEEQHTGPPAEGAVVAQELWGAVGVLRLLGGVGVRGTVGVRGAVGVQEQLGGVGVLEPWGAVEELELWVLQAEEGACPLCAHQLEPHPLHWHRPHPLAGAGLGVGRAR